MTNDTLTPQQTENFDVITRDEPSAEAQDAAALLLASCTYTTTALMAIAAVLRDDCADADAELLTALADIMARHEARTI